MALLSALKNVFSWEDQEEIEAGYEAHEERLSERDSYQPFGMSAAGERRPKRESRHGYGHPEKKGHVKDNNVISMHNQSADGVIAKIHLSAFDDVKKISAHLKMNRVVIADLNSLDHVSAQRALDFICGTCDALNADIQKGTSVGALFILTPNGTKTVGDTGINENLKYGGVFPWIN